MFAIKQPDQVLAFTYDFSAQLGGLAIALVSAVTNTARNATPALAEDSRATIGSSVVVRWSGGTDGDSYLTKVTVQDSAGAFHIIEGEITVADITFIVPTGVSTSYLTAEEYVQRKGAEETVRVTDETRSGVIDRQKLLRALQDATEEANSYLAGRYSVPLASAPPLLKGIVADLTRERLFSTRPTATVTDDAIRARSQLRDLSAGRMTLLLADLSEPEITTTVGFAAWGSSDAVVFNADKLARY